MKPPPPPKKRKIMTLSQLVYKGQSKNLLENIVYIYGVLIDVSIE